VTLPTEPGASPVVAVVPGATYVLTAYGARTGTRGTRARIDGFSPYAPNLAVLDYTNTSPLIAKSVVWLCPADGSVPSVQVRCLINDAAPAAGDVAYFDVVTLVGPSPGDGGMDRLRITWQSLG